MFENSSTTSILYILFIFTIVTVIITFNLPRLFQMSAIRLHEISEVLQKKMEDTQYWKRRAPGLQQRRKDFESIYEETPAESDWWYILFIIDYYIVKRPFLEWATYLLPATRPKMGLFRKLLLPIWLILGLMEFVLLLIPWLLVRVVQLLCRVAQGKELGKYTLSADP